MAARTPILALMALLSAAVLVAGPAGSAIAPLNEAMAERAIGDEKAPVTMIEYSSLGCPHCAAFHRDTLPNIKKAYIDTGKVRLIFRDFPLGGAALAASMLARCAPANQYFGLVEVLFREQSRWAQSQKPVEELERIGRMAGLSKDDVQACLNNQPLLTALRGAAEEGKQKHGIESTPSFVVDGKTYSGALPYEEFQKILDAALKKKQ